MLLNRTLRKPYDRWNNKNGNSLSVRRDESKEHAGLKKLGEEKRKRLVAIPQYYLSLRSTFYRACRNIISPVPTN